MKDDAVLLRAYSYNGSEAAFTELVHRHVDLVYGAALRRTNGDSHQAADVVQQVFTTLARQARKLSNHPVFSAWLHTATRNTAVNLMIADQRRKAREFEAWARDPATTVEPDWNQVRPVLDAAIDELPDTYRGVIVLRFLEQRPFAEVGAALRITADAARVRTERALEKLRGALARRGISSTAAALGTLVAQSAICAPGGLAASVSSAVFSGTGASSLLAVFMSVKTTATIASSLLVLGAGLYFGRPRANSEFSSPAPTAEQFKTISTLRQENALLKAEAVRPAWATATLIDKQSDPSVPVQDNTASARANSRPVANATQRDQQRAMLSNLRQIAAARAHFHQETGRPPISVDELVGETKYIRRLNPVDGENYSSISMLPDQILTVATPSGLTVTFDPSGRHTTHVVTPVEQQAEFARRLTDLIGPARMQNLTAATQKATLAYQAANKMPPAGPDALIPYFATPQDGADYLEGMELWKKIVAELDQK